MSGRVVATRCLRLQAGSHCLSAGTGAVSGSPGRTLARIML